MLPVWKVTRLPKNRLGIQCPRKDCQCKAVVSRNWLEKKQSDDGKTTFIGRACTYCFKASQIPQELVPKPRGK